FPVIAVGETASMVQTATLPVGPMAAGDYDVHYSVTSDQDANESNPANDVYDRRFQVNDLVFSIDGIAIHPTGLESYSAIGSDSFVGGADGLEIMSYYETHTTVTAYGITIELAAGTVAGSAFLASIYDTLSVLGTPANFSSPLAQSDIITVTDADIAAGH